MAIYAIGDLHLSFGVNKPMNVFGDIWEDYEKRLEQNWVSKVSASDTVILPGDFSWAMYLEETKEDFKFINNLPGKKILLKGNHDYWWNTVTKMRKYIKENDFKNIDFLYNDSYEIENKIIVGAKGWNISEDAEDIRITKRESERLELSINDGISKYGKDKEIIAFMHYPPLTKKYIETEYTKILQKYNIKKCYYAHLHATSIQDAIEGHINGVEYKLISSDALQFKLLKIN